MHVSEVTGKHIQARFGKAIRSREETVGLVMLITAGINSFLDVSFDHVAGDAGISEEQLICWRKLLHELEI